MKQSDYVKYSLTVIAILIVVLIAVIALKANPSKPAPVNQDSTPFPTGKVVSVGVTGSQYTFSPSQVKAGEKVSLVFDMSQVRGCARSVVIAEYGIRKRISENDKIIEFTPTKAGNLNIACSMNMYRGTLQVTE